MNEKNKDYLKQRETMTVTVKYGGHVVDITSTMTGYIAYLDNDLEPHDISEADYVEYLTNGKHIKTA